jgi:hypothetical protein
MGRNVFGRNGLEALSWPTVLYTTTGGVVSVGRGFCEGGWGSTRNLLHQCENIECDIEKERQRDQEALLQFKMARFFHNNAEALRAFCIAENLFVQCTCPEVNRWGGGGYYPIWATPEMG